MILGERKTKFFLHSRLGKGGSDLQLCTSKGRIEKKEDSVLARVGEEGGGEAPTLIKRKSCAGFEEGRRGKEYPFRLRRRGEGFVPVAQREKKGWGTNS